MRNCKIICCSASVPEAQALAPQTPKERYRLLRRLKRIEKHLEESRGTTMNLTWLGWMDQYMTVHDALGTPEDPYAGVRGL